MKFYYWHAKIPQCRYVEHGLKDVAFFYVQKHIAPWAICYNSMLVRSIPPGAPPFVRSIDSYGIDCAGYMMGVLLSALKDFNYMHNYTKYNIFSCSLR